MRNQSTPFLAAMKAQSAASCPKKNTEPKEEEAAAASLAAATETSIGAASELDGILILL